MEAGTEVNVHADYYHISGLRSHSVDIHVKKC